MLNIIWL